MKRHGFRNRGFSFRLSVALLLTIYLSVYPAVFLCDLHCEIVSRNEDTGQDSSHIHDHGHIDHVSQAGSTRPSEPSEKEKDSGERYSFCSFAQSISFIGIFTSPNQIAGIFEIASSPHFHDGEAVLETFSLNLHNRAPPPPSPA